MKKGEDIQTHSAMGHIIYYPGTPRATPQNELEFTMGFRQENGAIRAAYIPIALLSNAIKYRVIARLICHFRDD